MLYTNKKSLFKCVFFVQFVSDKQKNILVNPLYHTFRTEILSTISISVFHKHFCAHNGRPTKDLQSIIGLFLLQALKDLTDEEAIEAYCHNDAFRYALDTSRDEYLSERAYYYYRAKLMGEGHVVFNNILKTVAANLSLNHSIQRTDSTLVDTWLKGMSKLHSRILITRAGFPTAIAFAGMSFVTTEPAPTTAPFPIRTPLRTITPKPSQTSSSMMIGPFDVRG